jgi:glycosyltransferase involved in cell wall biosynthesis
MTATIPTGLQILPAAETPFLWSVMIPCYNPRPDYLEAALRSVLQQDPGITLMQIAVIDDASPGGAPAELVKKIAGDRVTIHREEKNLGLAGIWNRCIERAQGKWVHILHQDDLLLPGFYKKLEAGTKSPAAPGLLYCRHAFIDGWGRQGWLSELDSETSGCLPDALPYLARAQMIQTPSVIVRRSAYEALGGFRPDLCFTLDWEMWCRIAAQFPVWYEPEVLACYRMHPAGATSRLMEEGRDIEDIQRCIAIVSDYVTDPKTRAEVRRSALKKYSLLAMNNAGNLLEGGKPAAALRQMLGAFRCGPSFKILCDTLALAPAMARETVKIIFKKS